MLLSPIDCSVSRFNKTHQYKKQTTYFCRALLVKGTCLIYVWCRTMRCILIYISRKKKKRKKKYGSKSKKWHQCYNVDFFLYLDTFAVINRIKERNFFFFFKTIRLELKKFKEND